MYAAEESNSLGSPAVLDNKSLLVVTTTNCDILEAKAAFCKEGYCKVKPSRGNS
jgi:hypothetical protein